MNHEHSRVLAKLRRRRMFRRLRLSSLFTAASIISGCTLSEAFIPPTEIPTATPAPTNSTAPVESTWEMLAPGLERRFYLPGGDYALTQFVALRVDPAYYSFRAHYRPAAPLTVQRWREALPDAAAIINANFFDLQGNALGLVVADGVVYGEAFPGYGGMLQVQNGQVRVRSTSAEPYAGEALEQAVQAFPVLVSNGQASFSNPQGDRISRRTVVGQDSAGRIVLMTTPSFIGMTLVDLSSYLAASDLDLVTAVNLDGGGSSMMAVTVPTPFQVLSFDPVPAVLAVYAR